MKRGMTPSLTCPAGLATSPGTVEDPALHETLYHRGCPTPPFGPFRPRSRLTRDPRRFKHALLIDILTHMSGAAEALLPLVRHLCRGDPPLRMRFWDGSELGPSADAAGRDPAKGNGATVLFSSPNAVRRVLWMPNELGLARAYVAGEIDVQGDVTRSSGCRRSSRPPTGPAAGGRAWRAGGGCSRPRAPRARWAALSSRRPRRRACTGPDTRAPVTPRPSPTTTTCPTTSTTGPGSVDDLLVRATSPRRTPTLAEAQRAKYELICRKLGPAARRCAARRRLRLGRHGRTPPTHHGVQAVGVTLSPAPGRVRPRPRSRSRAWRPGRHPRPGLPRRGDEPLRRDLARSACSSTSAPRDSATLLRPPPRAARARWPAAEPRHQPPAAAGRLTRTASSAATSSRTAS